MIRMILSMLLLLSATAALPTDALAETQCRCAYPSLETASCNNELTARVQVLGGYTNTRGNNVYVAAVKQVYRGTAPGRFINIEAPRTCGFELRQRGLYAVAVSIAEGESNYSSFACSSFVKPFRELTREERAFLASPSCEPSACVDVTGQDFGLCKMLMGYAVRDGQCQPISGCGSDLKFYSSHEACMEGCAAGADEVCYRFSETNPDDFVNVPCASDLKCASTSNMIGFNVERTCKPLDYCIDESSAANDCADLIHIAVPGVWGCDANRCVWRVGPTQ